ncbi:MAG: hypothetical protein UR78_C0018G0008 [Candidatus Moranbacteria bacterium GW2011_GWF2_35_39]|nr:MAG: hypothetical protein UR78_C0018G0008 [Candidatus Moranbacteria bacterium GW2011_GWF2_35_39]
MILEKDETYDRLKYFRVFLRSKGEGEKELI